jgi:hypothetical protein
MDNCRADGSVTGEPGTLAATRAAAAGNQISPNTGADRREGDVISGLRSGLIFSLAIWAVLLTVGTLVFA